ncbi:30S ribosomal protein S6 [Candidatus Pelagibacter sp.]|nr:30S ribosomal protein S6 [Candidatus Pelagibacter sp.]
MNYYEHTIIARQDVSPAQLKQVEDKYKKIIENNEGNLVKTEKWGLMNLSYLIKKNKKGNYLHFKIEGNGKTISELEKNEKIDKNLLRYLTIKVKKLDLDTNYFEKKNNDEDKDFKDYKKKLNEK